MKRGNEFFTIVVVVLIGIVIIISAGLYYIIDLNKPHEHEEKMIYIMTHTQDFDDRSFKVVIKDEPDEVYRTDDIKFNLGLPGYGSFTNDSVFVCDCLSTKTITKQNLTVSITFNDMNNDSYLNTDDYFIISTWHDGYEKYWDVTRYIVRLEKDDGSFLGRENL
jgi:hypothetical protein